MQNIRSMQEDESFAIWVGLLIICLHQADDVRVSISRPTELVISSFLALRSPVKTEQIPSSLFM